MTIKVRQHYRNVNGKLVLVKEHEHKGNAAQHEEPQPHAAAVDDEFEKLFGGSSEQEPDTAEEPDLDAEFEKLFGEQVDTEFDKLFGGEESVEPHGVEEPSSETEKIAPPTEGELLGIGGSPWKEKGHDRIYFNGLAKLYEEATGSKVESSLFKGCKVYFDNKDGQFHSKNLSDTDAATIIEHLTKKAKEWGTQNQFAMKDSMSPEAATPKPGEKVPFEQLEPGMKLSAPSGTIVSVVSVDSEQATLKNPAGVSYAMPKSQWGTASLVYASDEQIKGAEAAPSFWDQLMAQVGAKVGETPKFELVEPGMVLGIDKAGTVNNLVIAVSDDKFWAQTPNGTIHEYTKSTWDAKAAQQGVKLTSKDGSSFEKDPLASGLKVGDTKVINGVTYRLNKNHRWERVDGEEDAGAKAKLEAIDPYGIISHATINGVPVLRSSHSLFRVMKNDENGKPLSKKMKDALAELHPTGYLKKKGYYLVRIEDLDKLAAILDGKAAEKPKAQKAKPTPLGFTTVDAAQALSGFPFTQIGPQKGSNPGGLYEDAAGKKWYIKFPQSEDHARNELLAAKFYALAGIPAPQLKLVKKDGKVGIASAFQEGLDSVKDNALLAKQDGVKEGFGVDAWLANWDTVGLANDNLLVGNDGKAVRIDVGGSLLYRAQGGPKGDAFGNVVTELHTLRDASKNPQSAAVFGGMTEKDLELAVAKVLKISDGTIIAAVKSLGPGTPEEKEELAKKLIARKAYLAKLYPNALKAHFDPSKITVPPNFENWNDHGKGLSDKDFINVSNNEAVKKVYEAALHGDLDTIKDVQAPVFNKDTGAIEKMVALGDHPSKHVRAYWMNLVNEVDLQLNPPDMPDLGEAVDGEGLLDIAQHLPPVPADAVGKVPKAQKAGRYITLGKIANVHAVKPKSDDSVISSAAWKDKANAMISKASHKANATFDLYRTTSGARELNTALRSGNIDKNVSGRTVKQHLEDFKELLVDVPQGSTFVRNMGMSGYGQTPSDHEIKELQQFLMTAEPGTVIQEPGFTSSSWTGGNQILSHNDIKWEFTAGPGVKVFPGWLEANTSEGEGLFPPGQRYAIIGAKKDGKTVKVQAILLPTV